jgi:1-aminocyclopropane-1-carboxylate deaminase/D-cysteine desulfhydrase-like pyridoxal-dependent ACC family enzyme
MDFDAIKKAAEGYKDDMVKFLRDMIRIPSESCDEEGVKTPVIGMSVNNPSDKHIRRIEKLIQHVNGELFSKRKIPITDDDIIVFDEYIGSGYSLPSEGLKEAVQLLARYEAILLDPVYTGKAMAGLVDLIRKGHFKKTDKVLFLHTGGSPALYHYPDYTL